MCRGVTVHKIHSSVWYNTVVLRFGMFLIQQKERNAREISLIFTNSLLKLFFTLNNDGAILDPSSGVSSWQHIKQK